jgi:REP element-mobilizing transposase RayT
MPKRRKFETDKNYHIYNRGIYKQTLFHDKKDFQRFLWYIDFYKEKCQNEVQLLWYCLLPNHFHFVLRSDSDGHKISYFIGNICAAYTRYYKLKYSTGKSKKFFEGRFKAKEINNSEYLQQCLYYVENNPLKHGLVEKVEDWIFRSVSSYPTEILENIDWKREF